MKPLICLICVMFYANFLMANSYGNTKKPFFIENKGQIKPSPKNNKINEIKYYSFNSEYGIHLMNNRINYILTGSNCSSESPIDVISLMFLNSNNDVELRAMEMNNVNINYYFSHCSNGISIDHAAGKVKYCNIYNNIDITVGFADNKLKYDFIIKPGADPKTIKLQYAGNCKTDLHGKKLIVESGNGILNEFIPKSFQIRNGDTIIIDVEYNVESGIVTFEAKDYDPSLPLIIDPVQSWSSFMGGSGEDFFRTVQYDKNGDLAVCGDTKSHNFPVTPGTYPGTYSGGRDIYISKFTTDGGLIWSTIIGGNANDHPFDMKINSKNEYWIAGESFNSRFPTTHNAYQSQYGGGLADNIAFKMSDQGKLLYSTYYGGSGYDVIGDIEIDMNDNLWACGRTTSGNSFRTTTNAFQPNPAGGYEAFLMCFDDSGAVTYSSFFGGNGTDMAEGIAIDDDNNIAISGYSDSKSLPGSNLGFQNNCKYGFDAFVAVLDSNRNHLWTTFYGGNGQDYGSNIDSYGSGVFVLQGYTASTDLVMSPNAFQKNNAGGVDSFIAKFDINCNLLWSTYFGGSKNEGFTGQTVIDQAGDIDIDCYGNMTVCGRLTNSPDLPVTPNAFSSIYGGNNDAYGYCFSKYGVLLFASYFGGKNDDCGMDAFRDDNGILYFVGGTKSSNFPIIGNAYQQNIDGDMDGWIVCIAPGCDRTAFYYPTMTTVEEFVFMGSADMHDNNIRLTNTKKYDAGAIWYSQQVPVKNGFTADFSFKLSDGANNQYEDYSIPGADGITFVLQNHKPDAIGQPGYGIGYHGIPNSLAVEIDLYCNDNIQMDNMHDPNGNHLALHCNGQSPNSADHGLVRNVWINDNIPLIKTDGTVYYVHIEYKEQPETLSIYIDSTDSFGHPAIEIYPFDITKMINLEKGQYCWVGLTSSTGNAWQYHDILNFEMCPFPADDNTPVEESCMVNELSIFPNPANSILNINFNASIAGPYHISIVDIMGREAKSISGYAQNSGSIKFNTDINMLIPGIYLCRLKTGNKILSRRFSILR